MFMTLQAWKISEYMQYPWRPEGGTGAPGPGMAVVVARRWVPGTECKDSIRTESTPDHTVIYHLGGNWL